MPNIARGTMRCKLCGGAARWCPEESVWRHDGDPWEQIEQQFCDRYGYPIEVEEDTERSAVNGDK